MFWSEELLASQFDSWLWLMQIFEAPTSSPQIHTFVTWISSRHANTQTTVNQRNNCCFSVICRTWHEKAVLGSLEKSALDQIFCRGKIQVLLNHSKKNVIKWQISSSCTISAKDRCKERCSFPPPGEDQSLHVVVSKPREPEAGARRRAGDQRISRQAKASQGYTFNRSLHCGANAGWNKGKSTIWIVFINNLYYLISCSMHFVQLLHWINYVHFWKILRWDGGDIGIP